MRLGSTIATVLIAGFTLASSGAWAQESHEDLAPDWWACVEAAQQVQGMIDAPEQMLTAIALNETGRRAPNGEAAPWPWTINVGGRGYTFATKDQAVFAAQQLLNSGTRSFDVGCMQVNVFFHPRAFTSFEEAFDPLANVMYAADYLRQLREQTGSWTRAVELYHSYTEEFNQIYGARFRNHWDLARRRVADGDILMTARPLGADRDQAASIQLVGSRDQGETARTVLLGERAARYGRDGTRMGANADATPMVAALLGSYGETDLPTPFLVHAGIDLRTAAIVRRFDPVGSGETDS
jgi:hypothetical protein